MLLPLLLSLWVLPLNVPAEEDLCHRFCPEDVQAVMFRPKVRDRLDFIQTTMDEAIKGLETLRMKSKAIPDNLKEQMGMVTGNEEDMEPKEMRSLLGDLIIHAIKSDQRAWGRIKDTQEDILDPSRAPAAPKSLTDLGKELEELEATWVETEESFGDLRRWLGSSLSKMMSPMMSVMDGMVNAAKSSPELKDLGLEKLKSQVDNLMGRVLLHMVVSKGNKEEVKKQPRLFEDIIDLAKKQAQDFQTKYETKSLPEFWEDQLESFVDNNLENKENDAVDVLDGDDVVFIVSLVTENM